MAAEDLRFPALAGVGDPLVAREAEEPELLLLAPDRVAEGLDVVPLIRSSPSQRSQRPPCAVYCSMRFRSEKAALLGRRSSSITCPTAAGNPQP